MSDRSTLYRDSFMRKRVEKDILELEGSMVRFKLSGTSYRMEVI